MKNFWVKNCFALYKTPISVVTRSITNNKNKKLFFQIKIFKFKILRYVAKRKIYRKMKNKKIKNFVYPIVIWSKNISIK